MKNQKHIICIFLVLITLSLGLMQSCRKASDNGKLDGQWQILNIETLDDGEIRVPAQRVYICLNLHVVQLTKIGSNSVCGNMEYNKSAGEINWDFPYQQTEAQNEYLSTWGVYSNPVRLQVVKLDGKTLILKTDKSVISCRRF